MDWRDRFGAGSSPAWLRHGSRIMAVAFVMAVAGTAYVAWRGHAGPAASPLQVRITTPAVPNATLVYLADANGYFAEEGLSVTIIPTIHGAAAVERLRRGESDLAMASDVVFVLSSGAREPLAIAANVFSSAKDLAVVARRDRGIAGPHDLAGKRIGVTFGTAGEYFLQALFIRNKLRLDESLLVDMRPAEVATALAAGRIDAAATWQPYVLVAEAELGGNSATYYANGAYVETFKIFGRGEFLRSNQAGMEGFLRALVKAEAYVRRHREEALRMIAGRLGIGVEGLRPSWNDAEFRVDISQSQLMGLDDIARWGMRRGYLPGDAAPDFLARLSLDPLSAVDATRVTVAR